MRGGFGCCIFVVGGPHAAAELGRYTAQKTMKYFVAVLTLSVCFDAAGQSVQDTLGNKRYYPLQVGNEWQYTETAWGTPIPSYHRIRILSDTTSNGHRYFKRFLERFNAAWTLEYSAVTYLRYNAVGAVIEVLSPAVDTIASNDSLTYWYHADFGDSLETDYGLAVVGGAYDSTLTFSDLSTRRMAAVKTLYVPDPLTGTEYYEAEVWAADIGSIGYRAFDGPDTWLSYANVAGVEYGERVVSVGVEKQLLPSTTGRSLELYPNPARNVLHVIYEVNGSRPHRVNVYDVLGRKVIEAVPQASCYASCTLVLDISGLPGGVYTAVMSTESSRAFRSFTVVP